ncbi:hypothetical protein HET69_34635 [Streptomyces sp. CJ_13]|uniref:hypothetical protein n=1 Tax=Streptomyces sp. CJ_13 TaxID=2724943 RepID=UPI001BDD8033|nr:hypothetical protein [Streptomyces sp. CJ_13]MBT1188986.1 hypothetical protein [Streptomyces sp. CJ_13]
MDKGTAAVIAAGLGIGGVLLGAIGNGALTARNMRRQVKDQADVEHRHWLRQQRQEAYTSFLTACDTVLDALAAIATLRENPEPQVDVGPLWVAYNRAFSGSLRAVYAVTVVGPNNMGELARHLQDFFPEMSRTLRDLEWPDSTQLTFDGSRVEYWDRYTAFGAWAGLTLTRPADSHADKERAELDELYEKMTSDSEELAELEVGWQFG